MSLKRTVLNFTPPYTHNATRDLGRVYIKWYLPNISYTHHLQMPETCRNKDSQGGTTSTTPSDPPPPPPTTHWLWNFFFGLILILDIALCYHVIKRYLLSGTINAVTLHRGLHVKATKRDINNRFFRSTVILCESRDPEKGSEDMKEQDHTECHPVWHFYACSDLL